MNCTFPSKHSPETNNMMGQMFHSYKQIFIADIIDPSCILRIYQPPNSVCVCVCAVPCVSDFSQSFWGGVDLLACPPLTHATTNASSSPVSGFGLC